MDQAPVQAGQVLAGKYRIDKMLGAGGMGVVVAATHLDLGEPVAIKFLLERALDSELRVARFLREAKAAAKIRSEHAVRVYDVGQLDSGAPYMVMEHLEGDDLASHINLHGALSLPHATELVLQACEALATAHAIGIVHRDIKPSNLFLAKRQDDSVTVKVIDFGISKMALDDDDDSSGHADMTHSNAMIGSPRYMAPEQMRSAKHVDMRADIWSLGATLYMMLTAEPPFSGNTIMAICESIVVGYGGLGGIVDAPSELDTVIQRCLQRDSDKRFANVAELAAALAPFAPTRALHLVERIVGTLEAADVIASNSVPLPRLLGEATKPLGSVPPPQGHSLRRRADKPTAGSEDTELAPDDEPASASVGSAEERNEAAAGQTQEAWTETRRAPTQSRRVMWVGAVAAAVALVLGGWLLMPNSNQAGPATKSSAATSRTGTDAAARPRTSERATPTATAVASTTVTTSTLAPAPPAPVVTSKPPASATGAARPQVSAQPPSPSQSPHTASKPKDLWADPY